MKENEKLGTICFKNFTIVYEDVERTNRNVRHKRLVAYSLSGDEMSYISFKILGDYVWLLKVETHTMWQHKGLASKLMCVLEYIAAQKEAKVIEGRYHPFNEFALPFYQKNNFLVPNQTDSEEDYDDTWRLCKDVDPIVAEKNYNDLIQNATKVDMEICPQRNK